jgi:hypothetical protein
MGAKRVGYWDDLNGMPEQGPFIVCGGPVGANVPRIEQVRGPDGVGCPVCVDMKVYDYMKANDIPRGFTGASRLNELYHEGKLVWDGNKVVPARA